MPDKLKANMKFDKAALADGVLAHLEDIRMERSDEADVIRCCFDAANHLLPEVSDGGVVVEFHTEHEHFYDFNYKDMAHMAAAIASFLRDIMRHTVEFDYFRVQGRLIRYEVFLVDGDGRKRLLMKGRAGFSFFRKGEAKTTRIRFCEGEKNG
jgi:hypothetical protein